MSGATRRGGAARAVQVCVGLLAAWPGLATGIEVSAGVGVARLHGALWSELRLGVTLRDGPFLAALRLPVRTGLAKAQVVRRRDWDDRSEWLRLAPRLAYRRRVAAGRLPALAVQIAPTAGATLGHGSLMRGYRSGLLPDHFKSGLRVDIDGDALGLQLVADDVTRFDLVGVRLFARPLSRSSRRSARSPGKRTPARRSRRRQTGSLRDLTVAISAVADRSAPMRATRDATGALRVDAAGRPRMSRAALVLAGVDVGLPIALSRDQHLVPYVDVNLASVDVGRGGGLHAGLWWSWRGAAATVRLRWEVRRSEGAYRPGWIDGFYELERTQLGEAGRTKASAWIARGDGGRWGHLLEAHAATPRGWRLAASWETWHGGGGDRPDDTASVRIASPIKHGVQLHAAWALRPGHGQQALAAAARWQGRGPWHAWLDVARTWHADAGRYRLQLDATVGIGMRWAW